MTKCVVVLPSIVPAMTVECLASLHPSIISPEHLPAPPTNQRATEIAVVNGESWSDGTPDVRLVVVWNTPEHNAGVGQSWEIGRQEVIRTKADWLVLLSAGIRFGPEGGRDFLNELDYCSREFGCEADGGLGWHLLGLSRTTLLEVGAFDPIYEVGYFEDVDYSWRLQCCYNLTPEDYPLWPKVKTDAALVEVAHGIKCGGVTVDMAGNQERFVAKWGGVSTREQWCHPYDDEALDYTFTGPYVPVGVQ